MHERARGQGRPFTACAYACVRVSVYARALRARAVCARVAVVSQIMCGPTRRWHRLTVDSAAAVCITESGMVDGSAPEVARFLHSKIPLVTLIAIA